MCISQLTYLTGLFGHKSKTKQNNFMYLPNNAKEWFQLVNSESYIPGALTISFNPSSNSTS